MQVVFPIAEPLDGRHGLGKPEAPCARRRERVTVLPSRAKAIFCIGVRGTSDLVPSTRGVALISTFLHRLVSMVKEYKRHLTYPVYF